MNILQKWLSNKKVGNVFENLSKIGKGIIAVLVFASFLYLSVWSMLGTVQTGTQNDKKATLYYNYDNVILNIIVTLLIIVIIYTFFYNFFERINPKIFSSILSVYVLVLGVFWIVSVKSMPTTDSKDMIDAAHNFLNGIYDNLIFEHNQYFYRYPFQLGYTFLCQIVISIFKNNYYLVLQIINVLSLICIYLGLIKIVSCLFNNKKITNITIFLFFFFVQAIMFCTFMYGTLMGFAFGIWAVYFAIDYIKNNKKLSILICSVLLAISIMLKPNDMIIMVAICIVLLLNFLETRKLFNIVAVLMCFLIGNNLIYPIIGYYENSVDTDFGDGMPKILWVNMGLHESENNNRYGWFNPKYGKDIFRKNNFDGEIASEIATKQVLEQIEYFNSNPSYANEFFTKKVLSTWNDPTFYSIFISKGHPHDGDVSEFVENVYSGNTYKLILVLCNWQQQIIFIFSCVFLGTLFKKKDVSLYILPLIILGGFLYHLIFETKTYYAITYFILLIPMAGYTLNTIFSKDFLEKLKGLFKQFSSEKIE